MLETVTQGFKAATERLRGVRELTEESIDESLRDVRMSLLEADVDLTVAKDFLTRVKERALGEKVETRSRDARGRKVKVTPGQHFVAICEEELVNLMGPVDTSLVKERGATSIMLVGLQGVGKTTIAAKLASYLKRQGRRPLLVAADIYRPAAVDQLKTLGASIDVPVHSGEEGEKPPEICKQALARARGEQRDAIIYDTAGRLAVDKELMEELEEIRREVAPANTLLVCDALMGRDAVNVAKTFNEQLPIDGICMTKLDGDARGGAALAVKAVTGVPIKFIGTGESVDRLEEFRPEGLASRILGMGDIVGLVKDFEEVVDEQQAEEDAERILRGKFTLEDLVTQLKTIQKMGPLKEVFSKLPGMGGMAEQVEETELVKVEAMIGSMTLGERRQPELIDKSRTSRIAQGSGRKPKEVTDLLKRFDQMREMMTMLGQQSGLLGKVPGMGKMAGAGMGGFPGMGGMGGLGGLDPTAMLGGGAGRSAAPRSRDADARRKNKRKQAKKSRKKGRKN
ncbi:MAG: signal recognition particle protein [Deltaproteobacteria bacterium]|nr:signal recognition particle protein [Deltaproteobacteria bacterium]MBW2417012.1 signal recognition particle protein [Deltaproteobacteria bacterium]